MNSKQTFGLAMTVVGFLTTGLAAQAQSTSVNAKDLAPATTAAASSNTNTTKIETVAPNKKFSETEVTDAKLKADGGSLSKYSLSFNLSYFGPPVNNLSAKDQPNPENSIKPIETAISGSLGGRYRFSSDTSLRLGSGLKAVHPFHGMERFDLNDPFVSLNVLGRLGDLQMRNSVSTSYVTTPNYTKAGEYGTLGYDNSLVYNFSKTRLGVGFDSSASYFLYNRAYKPSDRTATLYNFSFIPNVKYNFSDALNVSTSVAYTYSNRRSYDDQLKFDHGLASQRLTLGYAYTRDIYLSPYISFYTDKLAADQTLINFSATISLL